MPRDTTLKSILLFIALCCTLSTGTAGDNPRSIKAVRVSSPPTLDGFPGEAEWKLATPATDFIQQNPYDGQPASYRSEVRVIFDDEALYFACMFSDPEPNNIVSRLTRRDNEIESDRASIRIDSYHDHQTGYEFTFNAAGVKVDILQFDDAELEDASWDPVWDVRTQITHEGWTAEVKIPFDILRYKSGGDSGRVWGINFLRYVSRDQELDRWAHTPKSQTGFISRFGHLEGLDMLPEPRRIEVLPFVVAKQLYEPSRRFSARREDFLGNAGLDIKFGLSSNFTLDATVNPDFGQVEADPALLNLSTFETFYPEKRPFFIEGTQIIRFSTFGGDFGPGMFYTRRIGKAISPFSVRVPPGGMIEELPQNTTILGAAKLSGKTNGGLSLGMLEAVTQEERAIVVDSQGTRTEHVVEPAAQYGVFRLKQDLLTNSNVGMIVTSVAKRSRRPALSTGMDWNLLFDNTTYSVNGFVALSHTTNVADERITGSAGKIEYAKIAGKHWLWALDADYTTKKYNINDIGFFFRPNDYGSVVTITYKEDEPAKVVRDYNIGLFLHERRNFDEINLIREAKVNTRVLFMNYWRMTASAGADVGQYDDRETRGEGLYRRPKNYSTSTYVFSDTRNSVIVKLGQRFSWDGLRKRHSATEFGVEIRPLSWMDWSLESEYQKIRNQEAWLDNVAPGGTMESVFGDRTTEQFNVTARGTVTFTRELTLQVYSQLFLAKGHHANLRRLEAPDRFGPISAAALAEVTPDFNDQTMNSNLVLRWEYLPGSTMFLVWSQARSGGSGEYFTSLGDDFGETFRLPPSNVILLKMSYWWNI